MLGTVGLDRGELDLSSPPVASRSVASPERPLRSRCVDPSNDLDREFTIDRDRRAVGRDVLNLVDAIRLLQIGRRLFDPEHHLLGDLSTIQPARWARETLKRLYLWISGRRLQRDLQSEKVVRRPGDPDDLRPVS